MRTREKIEKELEEVNLRIREVESKICQSLRDDSEQGNRKDRIINYDAQTNTGWLCSLVERRDKFERELSALELAT